MSCSNHCVGAAFDNILLHISLISLDWLRITSLSQLPLYVYGMDIIIVYAPTVTDGLLSVRVVKLFGKEKKELDTIDSFACENWTLTLVTVGQFKHHYSPSARITFRYVYVVQLLNMNYQFGMKNWSHLSCPSARNERFWFELISVETRFEIHSKLTSSRAAEVFQIQVNYSDFHRKYALRNKMRVAS